MLLKYKTIRVIKSLTGEEILQVMSGNGKKKSRRAGGTKVIKCALYFQLCKFHINGI